MWKYNYTDELYHFKYSRKYLKNGKFVYVYPEQGGFNGGSDNYQRWKSLTTKKGFNVTGYRGKNSNGSYIGFDIGTPKDNYKFKEKNRKIGNYTINMNNENGQRSITVFKNNKSKDKTKYISNKGRSRVESIINRLRKK